MGIGASAHIRNKYINPVKGRGLKDGVVVWQEVKKRRRKDVTAVVFIFYMTACRLSFSFTDDMSK